MSKNSVTTNMAGSSYRAASSLNQQVVATSNVNSDLNLRGPELVSQIMERRNNNLGYVAGGLLRSGFDVLKFLFTNVIYRPFLQSDEERRHEANQQEEQQNQRIFNEFEKTITKHQNTTHLNVRESKITNKLIHAPISHSSFYEIPNIEFNRKKLHHSIKQADAILAKNPQDLKALFKRGLAYMHLYLGQHSLQHQLDGNKYKRTSRSSNKNLSKKLLEKSRADFNKLLELDSQNAPAFFWKGISYFAEQGTGHEDFQKALAADGKMPWVRHFLALSIRHRAKLNQHNNDTSLLKEEVSLNPNPLSLEQLALISHAKHHFPYAVEQLEAIRTNVGDTVSINYNLARSHIHAAEKNPKHLKEAIIALNRELEKSNDGTEIFPREIIHALLGQCYAKMGTNDLALEHLQKSLQISDAKMQPTAARQEEIALLLQKMNQLGEAKSHIISALQSRDSLHNHHLTTYINMANIMIQNDGFDAVMKQHNHAITLFYPHQLTSLTDVQNISQTTVNCFKHLEKAAFQFAYAQSLENPQQRAELLKLASADANQAQEQANLIKPESKLAKSAKRITSEMEIIIEKAIHNQSSNKHNPPNTSITLAQKKSAAKLSVDHSAVRGDSLSQ